MERVHRPALLIWLRLARLVQHVDRVAEEHLKRWDLNLAQFDVLAQVSASEGRSQQELADRLLVTKGNVCQILNRMEARGLIVRCPEGRANNLYLTESGRSLAAQVVPAHERLIAGQFSDLSPAEQRLLLSVTRRVERALRVPE